MYTFIHEILFIIFFKEKSYLRSQFNESSAAILCIFKNAWCQLEYFVWNKMGLLNGIIIYIVKSIYVGIPTFKNII